MFDIPAVKHMFPLYRAEIRAMKGEPMTDEDRAMDEFRMHDEGKRGRLWRTGEEHPVYQPKKGGK